MRTHGWIHRYKLELTLSRADYLRMYRKQALEILILLGGKEIWLEMDSESRRCVRAGLLEICRFVACSYFVSDEG